MSAYISKERKRERKKENKIKTRTVALPGLGGFLPLHYTHRPIPQTPSKTKQKNRPLPKDGPYHDLSTYNHPSGLQFFRPPNARNRHGWRPECEQCVPGRQMLCFQLGRCDRRGDVFSTHPDRCGPLDQRTLIPVVLEREARLREVILRRVLHQARGIHAHVLSADFCVDRRLHAHHIHSDGARYRGMGVLDNRQEGGSGVRRGRVLVVVHSVRVCVGPDQLREPGVEIR